MTDLAHEPFPEHEKLKALGERKDEIQSFIDWLLDDQQMTLAMYGEPRYGYTEKDPRAHLSNENHLYELERAGHPITRTFRGRNIRERIMAAYFGIDLDKISDEKDEMLASLRAMNS